MLVAALFAPVNNDSIDVKLTMPCENNQNIASCPVLEHSCALATDPTNFYGDPAVRIAAVMSEVSSTIYSDQQSACDPASYPGIFDSLTSAIDQRLQVAGCISSAVAEIKGAISCVVSDISQTDETATTIPACAANAPSWPCWKVVDQPKCPTVHDPIANTDSQRAIVVCREATCDPALSQSLLPPSTTTTASCAAGPGST